MPEPMPPGLTFLVAITLAIVSASFVNRPGGGCVELVLILCDHFFVRVFFADVLGSFLWRRFLCRRFTRHLLRCGHGARICKGLRFLDERRLKPRGSDFPREGFLRAMVMPTKNALHEASLSTLLPTTAARWALNLPFNLIVFACVRCDPGVFFESNRVRTVGHDLSKTYRRRNPAARG